MTCTEIFSKTFVTRLVYFSASLILLTGSNLPGASAQSASGKEQVLAPRPAAGIYPATNADDNLNFVSIFDGKTLNGWDGDTTFWRAENGVIIGETTADKVVKLNNFLIWRGARVKDFELKVDFKINGTNSGIQFRSTEMPELGKWVLKGYQADIEFTNGYTGNIHEERGRSGHVVLSRRGEVTRAVEGPAFKTVATIADPTLLKGVINIGGWNQYHIIARGPVILQIINGQLISVLLDEDSKNFTAEGVIGFQMHTGRPFKIEYRNILYKAL
ncbi:DUF1080 domain-containing protein [Pedobacter sp. P351]|uniref:3-keto-disaccharide hydrolase n=1 Tax=Pedobacter superstes TaxID=3133441 RepID=UPI0030A12043